MDEQDKPPLGAYAYEKIAQSLHEIDKSYWAELSKMRAKSPFTVGTSQGPTPAPPRLPEHLRVALCSYARQLFQAESYEYPASPQIGFWLTKLAERVADRVMRAVEALDKSLFDILFTTQTYGLSYHGLTIPQMRQAVEEHLEEIKSLTLAGFQPAIERDTEPQSAQLAVEEPHSFSKSAEAFATPPTDLAGIVERRMKLLDGYKAATGNPSSKKIYEAENSGINKPEFYEWKNGRLPDRSRTTKQFEAFLTAKRRLIPKKPTT